VVLLSQSLSTYSFKASGIYACIPNYISFSQI
jgi:hypothetical protein